jgi:peptide/nickel transport system substrate-binding protein
VEYRILGRLEVVEHGQRLPLGGARQRALLAVLLLHRREVVSLDHLIESLWGDSPPLTAAKTIQVYVSRLRKVLGVEILETCGRGYRLAVDPGLCDLDRFDALIAQGRAAADRDDPGRAVELLGQALALWRDPGLDEFSAEPFAEAELAHLTEARLAALEDRIDATLALGRGPELVVELEQLAAEHPLRERLAGALMLALYRAGRQADALTVYRTTRKRLVEELGLEPSPTLRELERGILQHDPDLAPRRNAIRSAPRRVPALRRRAVLTTAVLLAVFAAGMLLGAGQPHVASATLDGADGLVVLSPHSGKVISAMRTAGAVAAMGTGSGSVWAAQPGSSAVSRIDPRSTVAVDRLSLDGGPGAVVSGDGSIWVASTVGSTLTRIDPETERITQTIVLPGSNLDALAYGAGKVWVADPVARRLFEVDPASGSLRRSIPVNFRPSALVVAAGDVWIAGYDNRTINRLDPVSARVTGRVLVGDGPVALSFGAGSLWSANNLDATVSRIDPGRLKVTATIPVASGPTALLASGGSVWVASGRSGTVSWVDPASGRIVTTVNVGGAPTSLALSAGKLWVAVGAGAGTHRGGTLVLVTTQRFASLDPAFYDVAQTPQFIGLTYDTLVTFQHSGGKDGSQLVPDLALSIPTPTHGGTTYTFQLRPGIRYSDGQIMRAGDFRRAIERLFRLGSPGSSFFTGIVGAAACTTRRAGCDLSRGVLTDDRTGTVTFNLTAPDADFLYKLTEQGYSAPVPPRVPDHAEASTVPLGTGPYRIVTASERVVKLERNPWFREWSGAAQPEGNPDAIQWRFVASAQEAVDQVADGQADWFFGLIPARQYRSLQLTSPSRVHSSPQFAVDFVHLNTHLAPFNDVRVRRALNYAIDRRALVRMYDGGSYATPTCQPLAPGLPGYRRYCPYTINPSPSGAWTGPDLRKARELVRQSGTRGERIDLWGALDESFTPAGVPAYVASVLRSLGYRVRVHLAVLATVTVAARRHHQLSADGDWIAEYPAPSAYISQFFSCEGGNSNGYFCDAKLDAQMRRALRLERTAPARASRLWTVIDHRLTDEAAWVPTVNLSEVDLVSSRLRNYQYNPVWGFLVDQSWLG